MDIRRFFIKPNIPEKLSMLHEMAFNLWSCWDKDAEKLFHRIDPQLYRTLNHNPVELLYRLPSEHFKEVSQDKGFLYELKQVHDKFNRYLSFEGSYMAGGEEKTFSDEDVVVYICSEYGLHESLPVYSGGLAVLAGDMLKAVSDVGFRMVSFGLLYRYGYFNQYITSDGSQVEEMRENTWYLCPVEEVLDSTGSQLIIEIPLKGDKVFAKLWKIQVGRVPLYLLDTNIHQNLPKYRTITNQLYDSSRAVRLEQELILGRGAVIALKALGIEPKIYHLNEGHTAFSILERLLDLTKNKEHSLADARTIIQQSTVFTTHTPVAAGNENFSDELIREYLKDEVEALGMTMDQFLNLGKTKKDKYFWLPALALRYSAASNAVSKLHTHVSKQMWKDIFPTMHEKEFPIRDVTNGVHLQSWLSLQMTELFNRYIGPDYLHRADQSELWNTIYEIPDGEIWNAHRRRKEQVVSFIRRRITEMMRRRGYCKNKIKDVEKVLNPEYLTIGFARRFAQYKRANLILRDPERLVSILKNQDKPVQLVFSGKAHPADGIGKDLIKQLIEFINKYPVETHVVFIEDYDINVARHIVQGVDVWLNTPIKPLEASGTSGMKAGINGVLNLSVLDGWWPECFNGENGWAITAGDISEDPDVADDAEANQLYELIENEITELYYMRAENDIPLEWVKMMKSSMATVNKGFNMHRAVREYLYNFYMPLMETSRQIKADNYAYLKRTGELKHKIDAVWPSVYIKDFFTSISGRLPISGERIEIDCYAFLGDADEKLVDIEIFYGYGDKAESYKTMTLQFVERYPDKVAKYSGGFTLEGIGLQEISVRIVPADAEFRKIHPEYIKWKD